MKTTIRIIIWVVIIALAVWLIAWLVGRNGGGPAPAPAATSTPATTTEPVSGRGMETYASSTMGFSIQYPSGYTVDDSYAYQALGPGKEIPGVKFTIPASEAAGTNLGTDTYLSVERVPSGAACARSVSSTTDAAAGNRYEVWLYPVEGSNPCLQVRYLIHYGVFQNYPAGSIKEFDENSLLAEFDSIRRSLTLGR